MNINYSHLVTTCFLAISLLAPVCEAKIIKIGSMNITSGSFEVTQNDGTLITNAAFGGTKTPLTIIGSNTNLVSDYIGNNSGSDVIASTTWFTSGVYIYTASSNPGDLETPMGSIIGGPVPSGLLDDVAGTIQIDLRAWFGNWASYDANQGTNKSDGITSAVAKGEWDPVTGNYTLNWDSVVDPEVCGPFGPSCITHWTLKGNATMAPLPDVPPTTYNIFEINELGPNGGSRAFGLNNFSEVVGESKYGTGGPGTTIRPRPIYWSDGTLIDIDYPEARHAVANDINDNGLIVGEVSTPGGTRAFTWQNNVMVILGTLGGTYSIAHANNNSSEVVGTSRLADGSATAFVWSGGVMTELPRLAGTNAHAYDINAGGVIVGDASVLSSYKPHATVWKNGIIKDLGTIDNVDGTSGAGGINDLNQIVGGSTSPIGGSHAVLWDDGVLFDLGTYEDDTNTGATDINNAGTIIGNTNSGPYILEDGEMTLLCDLIDCASHGWDNLSRATGINESGDIVGYGVLNGELKGFLLQAYTPLPEVAPTPEIPRASGGGGVSLLWLLGLYMCIYLFRFKK